MLMLVVWVGPFQESLKFVICGLLVNVYPNKLCILVFYRMNDVCFEFLYHSFLHSLSHLYIHRLKTLRVMKTLHDIDL